MTKSLHQTEMTSLGGSLPRARLAALRCLVKLANVLPLRKVASLHRCNFVAMRATLNADLTY